MWYDEIELYAQRTLVVLGLIVILSHYERAYVIA